MDTDTLGEALPRAMKRVREKLIPAYQEIGSAGRFALAMMNDALTKAEKALAEGDVIAMMQSYQQLEEFKL